MRAALRPVMDDMLVACQKKDKTTTTHTINMHVCVHKVRIRDFRAVAVIALGPGIGIGIVAAPCRVPAQAPVAHMREAAPASARARVILAVHLAAAGRRGVLAHRCLGSVSARSSPPTALSGVLPRSWGGGHGARCRPGRGRRFVRRNRRGVGRLRELYEERVRWQLVHRVHKCRAARRWRWRKRCAARRWQGGGRRPPVYVWATRRWRSGTSGRRHCMHNRSLT